MAVCLAGQRIDVTLSPGVTLTVSVLGPEGGAVSGAQVDLRRNTDNFAGMPSVNARGVTDASGVCRLSALTPRGSGTVMVAHPLGAVWRSNVQLADSGESSIELRLPAGRTITGVARDAETGEPVPDARVSDAWTFRRVIRTDGAGRFSVVNATGETFGLWAKAEGYADGSARIEAETEVTIELDRAATLVGRLLDPEDKPVAGARIAVISQPAASLARVNVHGRSGEDGRFRIEGLSRSDPHVVIVIAEGLVRYVTDTDPVGTADEIIDIGDCVAAAGTPRLRARGELVRCAADRRRRETQGANTDRSRLREQGGAVAKFYGTEESCWTDDRGRVHFTDVAPGRYGLSAVARGRKNAGTGVEVADADVDEIELTFVGGTTFRASVEDDSGRPIAEVSVTARTADGWPLSVPTRADGIVEFDSDSRIVSVEAFSWNNGDDRYVAPPAAPVQEGSDHARIVLRRVTVASGTVRLPNGKPLAGGQFRVLVDGEVMKQESPFDSLGYVRPTGEFRALVPIDADAVIELVNASFVDEETGRPLRAIGRLEGVNGGDTGLVIHARSLPQDRSLDVLVLMPDGLPVPGAPVSAHLYSAQQPLPLRPSSRSGRAFFERLQAAQYALAAELPTGHPGRTAWVPPNETVTPQGQEVVLRFREGDRVAGRIVDAAGTPIAGATVEIYAGRQRLASHVSGNDGRFAFAVSPDATQPLYLFAYDRREGVAREYRDADFRPEVDVTLTLRGP